MSIVVVLLLLQLRDERVYERCIYSGVEKAVELYKHSSDKEIVV
jgi:hypothetical protein